MQQEAVLLESLSGRSSRMLRALKPARAWVAGIPPNSSGCLLPALGLHHATCWNDRGLESQSSMPDVVPGSTQPHISSDGWKMLSST